jgi:hypothetical protein
MISLLMPWTGQAVGRYSPNLKVLVFSDNSASHPHYDSCRLKIAAPAEDRRLNAGRQMAMLEANAHSFHGSPG